MSYLKELVDELEAMSVGEIRARFAEVGAKGAPMNPCSCPVASYIRIKTGATDVRAYPLAGLTADLDHVAAPLSVKLFMQQFDFRAFPELIAQ